MSAPLSISITAPAAKQTPNACPQKPKTPASGKAKPAASDKEASDEDGF